MVRVGSWCQGILKIGDGVTIERWQWRPEGSANTERGGWKRVVRTGSDVLPCDITFSTKGLEDKKNVQSGHLLGEVVENFGW